MIRDRYESIILRHFRPEVGMIGHPWDFQNSWKEHHGSDPRAKVVPALLSFEVSSAGTCT
jgi:hypothetical protein